MSSSSIQAEAIDPTRGFADLVDRVMPAVVSVQVKFANASSTEEGSQRMIPGLPEGPWGEFFKQFPQFREGAPGQRQRPEGGMGQGSGFIISADGYAVTNNHVVQDANEVTVTLNDGTELKAEVIGTDPKTDLALIKIDSDKKFDFVAFTGSEPRVGDWVMAVGNPFGLGGTVTTGIISARGRVIGAGPYDDFLQIDAAINRGNSGGPAFNLEGEVVGINTAIFSPSGGSVGIGFAIPTNMVKTVVATAESGSDAIKRPWLGAELQDVTSDIATSLGMARPEGTMVVSLHPQSPLAASGLRRGDVILAIEGKPVENAQELGYRVATTPIGSNTIVEYQRKGERRETQVTMVAAPETVERQDTQIEGRNPLAGAVAANLSPAVADELGAQETNIGVGLIAVIGKTRGALHGLVIGMEGIGSGVRAYEALTRLHVVEESLLTGHGHRRVLVAAFGAEVAGGVEHHRVELGQVLRRELRAVLGEDELDVIGGTHFEELLLREAGLALLIGDHLVLVTRGLGEEEDLALRGVGGERAERQQAEEERAEHHGGRCPVTKPALPSTGKPIGAQRPAERRTGGNSRLISAKRYPKPGPRRLEPST